MTASIKILYLCTGNSCRSQMAEGWTRYLASGRCSVCSAGIEEHGRSLRAIAVMEESGVDIAGQESTTLTEKMLHEANLVVTVCGHAEEMCPIPPRGVRKIHWPLADPAKATGSEDEIMATFRDSRDEIRSRVNELLAMLGGESDL